MRFPVLVAAAALLLTPPLASAAEQPKDAGDGRSWTIPAVSAGQRLDIQLKTGAALSIAAWDRDEVNVETDWDETRCRDAEIGVQKTGQGVLIETHYPPGTGVITHNCSFGIVVKVPRRFDVRLRSAGGSVAISGVHGDFSGVTGGGKIELADLEGNVELRTGGGQIHVWDSDLEGRISTGGGQVRFDNVTGGVTARTGSRRGIVRGSRVRGSI